MALPKTYSAEQLQYLEQNVVYWHKIRETGVTHNVPQEVIEQYARIYAAIHSRPAPYCLVCGGDRMNLITDLYRHYEQSAPNAIIESVLEQKIDRRGPGPFEKIAQDYAKNDIAAPGEISAAPLKTNQTKEAREPAVPFEKTPETSKTSPNIGNPAAQAAPKSTTTPKAKATSKKAKP